MIKRNLDLEQQALNELVHKDKPKQSRSGNSNRVNQHFQQQQPQQQHNSDDEFELGTNPLLPPA